MARTQQRSRSAQRRPGRPHWEGWPLHRLLDLRLCDLGVTISGTWVEPLTRRLHAELADRGIRLRPHFWISDEWFSPTGVPGIAIPFYLAHPRLMRLERSQMLEVEGGSRRSCMKILRHEAGHVLQTAYQLHRRRRWRELFGSSSRPYPEYYRPNPASKRFVQYLEAWYAQAHPDEDFAETFAVWLEHKADWGKRYAGWPALRKIEYVDELMAEVGPRTPRVRSRATPDSLRRLKHTLREHYEEKRRRYTPGYSQAYDRDLCRLFQTGDSRRGETAAAFLRRHRREIRQLVARWTGEYQFTLDRVMNEMIGRCKELKLRAVGSEKRLKMDFAIMLTVHTTYYIYRGREWHAV